MIRITRRDFAAFAMALASTRAQAAGKKLDILGHKVMQTVLTTGPAGDLVAPWASAAGAEIAWTTFDIDPLQDRLFRECSLPTTSFGVGFLLNSRASPQAAGLFEPLAPHLQSNPIEAWSDVAPGLVQAMTLEGKLIAVPFRHATNGLFYNEALLEQRGISAPPKTLEEFVDQARKCTFRTGEGQPVAGFVMTATLAAFPVMFARAYGGDFITQDFKVIPNRDAMIKAFALLHTMFEGGILPRSFTVIGNDDQVTWLQQGRAAFGILPFSRYAQLNRADQSKFAGRLKAVEFPVSTEAPKGTEMAAVVEFWSMAIPKNAVDKDLGWDFIRAMSTQAATLGAARNGNGPVRVSTYADPGYNAQLPTAAVEARSLAKARVPYPAFTEASRAQGVFVEEMQAAILGRKSPAQAVQDTVSRVKPLLPA